MRRARIAPTRRALAASHSAPSRRTCSAEGLACPSDAICGSSSRSARISPTFSLVVEGLQVTPTDEEMEELGVTSATEPLLGMGGGVEIAIARRLGIEVGYQYNRF
jgi:hypothetical protein